MNGLIDNVKSGMRTQTATDIRRLNVEIRSLERSRDAIERHLRHRRQEKLRLLALVDEAAIVTPARDQSARLDRVLDDIQQHPHDDGCQVSGFEEMEAVQLAGPLPRNRMATTDEEYDLQ